MQYILAIFVILLIVGYFVSKWITKKEKKRMEENDNIHTAKQKEFFKGEMDYRGRKTEADWREWFSDMLEENKNN